MHPDEEFATGQAGARAVCVTQLSSIQAPLKTLAPLGGTQREGGGKKQVWLGVSD